MFSVCSACCIWVSTANHQAWRTSDSELHRVSKCPIEAGTARTAGWRSAWWGTTATTAATAASMYHYLSRLVYYLYIRSPWVPDFELRSGVGLSRMMLLSLLFVVLFTFNSDLLTRSYFSDAVVRGDIKLFLWR